ncbi:WD40 repeat domain-containing protein [Sporobolomyces salmoneus]|uniref:WD40 repeat domain-containing protein n=1 Tax=Sporobolomyces salmoneus TaxID=183962 RepID=UPI003181A6CE
MPSEPTPTLLSAEPGSTGQHFSLDVKFPVYSIAFTSDQDVVLAGGGGSSRTGVKNRLSMYKIDLTKKQLSLITEHELSKQEDAPMTIAIHRPSKTIAAGINSDLDSLKEGKNENLRMFRYTDSSDDGESTITFENRKQTLESLDPDHYQKVTTFSRPRNPLTPPLLALGSTSSQLSLLSLPNLSEVLPQLSPSQQSEGKRFYEGEEIFDVDFNDKGDMLVGTSSTKLCVWSTTPTTSSEKKKNDDDEEEDEFEPLQVIERPILKKELACTFRAAKFGRQSTSTNLYTVVNSIPSSSGPRKKRGGKGKGGDKKSFVSLWDTKEWKLNKTRMVGNKPVTSFDISEDGTLLAYGSSDLSIGILDAITLRPIMTILKAHDFPSTSLRFNPSSSLLVSGSADNSLRIIKVPSPSERGGENKMTIIWLTLLILLVAVLVQQGFITREAWNAARGIMN